jgi:hypothetical protein
MFGLVATDRHPLATRNLFQHQQRRVALGRPIGLPRQGVHNQPMPVLHQQIAAVTQLGLLALPLSGQLCIRIGLRLMRPVGSLLAVEVHGLGCQDRP